jgi:hypothetical protein
MTTSERIRALADWLEEHPDAQAPYNFAKGATFYIGVFDKEALAHIGSFKKTWLRDSLHAAVAVGEFTLVYFIDRKAVCTARVVGKRQVPEMTIEGTPTRVISAHEEDVIEWDCAPLLEGEETPAEVPADIPSPHGIGTYEDI